MKAITVSDYSYEEGIRIDLPRSKKLATLSWRINEIRKEGMEKGIEKGIIEARKILASKLILEKFPDEYIAKLTDLSIEEIKDLRLH